MAIKIQKEEAQRVKALQRGVGGTRRGRPRKIANIGIELQEPLPAFSPGSAYPDPEVPQVQGPYFRTNLEEVIDVEQMEEV